MKTTSTISRILFAAMLICLGWSCTPSSSDASDISETQPGGEAFVAANMANQEFLQKMAEPSQKFKQDASKPFEITGKNGTIIKADPQNLSFEDGSPVTGEIEVELKELMNVAEMVFNSAPTTSGGKLLETGGSYYINMTADGRQLKIKEGKAIQVNLPKSDKEGMELFVGKRDANGVMDWQPTQEQLTAITPPEKPEMPQASSNEVVDSTNSGLDDIMAFLGNGKSLKKERKLSPEERKKYEEELRLYKESFQMAERVYETAEFHNFGWYNCDRFYEDPAPKTNVIVEISDPELIAPIGFLCMQGVEGMMNADYGSSFGSEGESEINSKNNAIMFQNLPIGRTVHLLVFGFNAKGPQMSYSSFKLEQENRKELKFEAKTENEVRAKIIYMNTVVKES
jgi:hypothetical protein